ncbi:MAG: PLP-dependent aminotransferase family protein [Anaerolineales bacterium]
MHKERRLRLSAESAHLTRSVMRDLLSFAVDPAVISFAGGLPASDVIPLEAYKECIDAVLDRDGPAALQYSPQYAPLREWIASWMQTRGVSCQPEQVFITNGAQQGLAVLSRLLLDPGEPAVVEAITFTGIQQVTKGRGAEVRAVPTDPTDGVDIDLLEAAMKQAPQPRMAILIPAFHNPLSATLEPDQRRRIAALAAETGVPVIEDDPYSALQFDGEMYPPIKAFDEAGFVFYVGSFSKILAPGVRLGWIVAPLDLMPKITTMRESLDLETSTLTQRAVALFLERCELEPHLGTLRRIHRQRRDALLAALEKHLAWEAEWTEPDGGLFVWLTLDEGIDTWKLFERSVARQVAYIPGAAFAVEGGANNTIRLSFSNVTPAKIETGVARLAQVIREAGR